jgi:hypothetical protein
MTKNVLLALCILAVGSPAFAASDHEKLRKRIDKSVVRVTTSMTVPDIIKKGKAVCVCNGQTGLLTRSFDSDFITCLTFVFNADGAAVSSNNCGAVYQALPK